MDVLLRGGRVIDPVSGTDEITDVRCSGARIDAIAPDLTPSPQPGEPRTTDLQIVDCHGAIVVPGLVDLHCHVMPGLGDFCVPADRIGVGSGVPVVVDGGSSGVATFDLARTAIIDDPRTRTRVLAFIDPNQLYLPTRDFLCHRLEIANDERNIDLAALEASMDRNADVIVGLKVRACHTSDPDHSPFLAAAQAASRGKPVMVRLGHLPHTPTIGTPRLLDALRPGDIVTHAFRGDGGMLDAGGRAIPELVAAVERGVRLDVGHSGDGFRFDEARRLFDLGFLPDTISTDLDVRNLGGPVHSLVETMTKILALGVGLADVVAMCTSNAAAGLGRSDELGTIRVGRSADLSVIRLDDTPVELTDGHDVLVADRSIRAVGCVRAGRWIGAALDRRPLAA